MLGKDMVGTIEHLGHPGTPGFNSAKVRWDNGHTDQWWPVNMLHRVQVKHDADRRDPWFDAVAQLVQALPRRDQQWAWVALIATDLCHVMPGLSLACSAAWVQARLGMKGEARS